MNQDQVTGILRAIIPAIIAYVVAKGWISASSAADIGAGAITILAAIWSVWNNTTASKTASVVASGEVVATPTPMASPATIVAAKSV